MIFGGGAICAAVFDLAPWLRSALGRAHESRALGSNSPVITATTLQPLIHRFQAELGGVERFCAWKLELVFFKTLAALRLGSRNVTIDAANPQRWPPKDRLLRPRGEPYPRTHPPFAVVVAAKASILALFCLSAARCRAAS